MRTNMFLILLFVNAISAFTSKQIKDRFNYIESRINAESTFRQEEFNILHTELGDIKAMLQQMLDSRMDGKDTVRVDVQDKTYIEIVDKVSMLTKAFGDEKNINIRFRREISNIQRHVQVLRTRTDQIDTTLEDVMNKLESLELKDTVQTLVDATKHFDQLQKQIPIIQENILNLENQFERKENASIETLAKMSIDIEDVQGNQERCLENMMIHNNLTKMLADKLAEGELYCTVKENIRQIDTISQNKVAKYKSCQDFLDNGNYLSGVYEIEIEPDRTISVYCDMKTDGGGWTVFQRRKDGSVDFYRNWNEYKAGFGDLDGEFWLGNEYLNKLTDTTDVRGLRVDLADHEGNHAFAKYSKFKVGPESENFKLSVTGYSGDAGDSLENPKRSKSVKHDGMEFSTKDRDNDGAGYDCANSFKGAWWYNDCFESNLNSLYQEESLCEAEWECIVWNTWKGAMYSMKFTEMKFR